MRGFLSSLVTASEKAALIARACRKESDLFQLLIEEKKGIEKNAKFSQDFKTLADVLIQETFRHDVGVEYPKLVDQIQGEESNQFTNTLGEKISVSVLSTPEETGALLSKVLDGREKAGELLAREVHNSNVVLTDEVIKDLAEKVPEDDSSFDFNDLGIWIDPIDSTNNYIRGNRNNERGSKSGFTPKGLSVVTVLIGVFSRSTGKPVLGVINRPFAEFDESSGAWKGEIYWGLHFGDNRLFSGNLFTNKSASSSSTQNVVVVSFTESEDLKQVLRTKYKVIEAAGAGYKILCTAMGWADFYVTAKGSTYKWDSCSGHAILAGQGGACIEFAPSGSRDEILYNQPVEGAVGPQKWSNAKGIIAYRDPSNLRDLIKLLDSSDLK